MTTLNMLFPITKVDAVQRRIWGSLASETVDKSKEIFDYESSAPLVQKWSDTFAKVTGGKSVGNLRGMHTKEIAGKFVELSCNDATKSIDACAEVNDPKWWGMVERGEVTALSIGGSYAKRWTDPEGFTRYTADPSEGSLVDNPCNPDCTFKMIKADGSEELRKFHAPAVPEAVTPPAVEAETPELEQVWKAKDGATFATKALAKAHNDEVAKAAADAADPLLSAPAAREAAMAAIAKAEAPKPAPVIEPAKAPEPAPVAKTAEERFEVLRKGLYSVSRLASLIEELNRLQTSTETESAVEGDASTVPASLKASITTLCATLTAMVAEETSELVGGDDTDVSIMLENAARPAGADALAKLLGDKAPAYLAKAGMRHGKSDKEHLDAAHDHVMALGVSKCAGMGADKAAVDAMAKAGARHSKVDAQHLQDAHDSLTKAGAGCPAKGDDATVDKAAPAGDLAKVLSDNELLKAELAKSNAAFGDIAARLAKIEAQPVAHPRDRAPGPLMVVGKNEDAAAQLETEIAKMSGEEVTQLLIKAARANGRQVTR